MKTGWLIQKRAIDAGILPENIMLMFARLCIPAYLVDIDVHQRLVGNIDPNIELWSSLGTIEFLRSIHKIDGVGHLEHYNFFCT